MKNRNTVNCGFEPAYATDIKDAVLAEAFATDNPDRVRYAPTTGWYLWDGKVWRLQESEDPVRELLKSYVASSLSLAVRVGASAEVIKALAAYRNSAKITGWLLSLRSREGVGVSASVFDADPDLLNTPSGVVDLRTGALAEWDPKLLMSRITKFRYSEATATHPDWDKALTALPDEDVRLWFQRLVGSGVTGHRPKDDISAIANGGGANGKTTVLGTVFEALGSYAVAVPDSALTSNTGTSDSVQFLGARFALLDETSEGAQLNVQMLKKLSNDVMKGRFLYKDYIEFRPTHTLLVSTNHKPIVRDTTHGAWRRLALVPFVVKYRSGDDAASDTTAVDTELKSRLLDGEDGRGEAVLAWLVAGARRWYANSDLSELPKALKVAKDEWRGEKDLIFRFANSELEFSPGFETSKSDMWLAYEIWADASGEAGGIQHAVGFSRQFQVHQVAIDNNVKEARRGRTDRVWVGVRLVPGGSAALAIEERALADGIGGTR